MTVVVKGYFTGQMLRDFNNAVKDTYKYDPQTIGTYMQDTMYISFELRKIKKAHIHFIAGYFVGRGIKADIAIY